MSGFLHEFVAVFSAFEDSWFQAPGSVGDFAAGDLFEELKAKIFGPREIDEAERQRHPGGEDVLTGTGETDLTRLFLVKQCSRGSGRANQVVSQ